MAVLHHVSAVGLWCATAAAWAGATFDVASGVLTLSAVQVGPASYTDVRLALVDPATYTFRLQQATPQVPAEAAAIRFDAASGVLTIPSVTVGAAAYRVTFRLTDAATYTFTLASATAAPAAARLYFGYYAEDAANNPEDPQVGGVLLAVPPTDASFAGLMPFTYVGCAGQADVGTVSGTRSGTALDGHWTGSVDGTPVGGSYAGSYDAASDSFAGSYTNAAGKVPFGSASCGGYIAALGRWKIYGAPTRDPAGFVTTASAGAAPLVAWVGLGPAALYAVRVFDEGCLQADASDPGCFKGEAYTTATAAQFPAEFPGADALAPGRQYFVLVTGQSLVTGAWLGFSSIRHSP